MSLPILTISARPSTKNIVGKSRVETDAGIISKNFELEKIDPSKKVPFQHKVPWLKSLLEDEVKGPKGNIGAVLKLSSDRWDLAREMAQRELDIRHEKIRSASRAHVLFHRFDRRVTCCIFGSLSHDDLTHLACASSRFARLISHRRQLATEVTCENTACCFWSPRNVYRLAATSSS